MKIAHCVNNNIAGVGGVEAHIIRLSEALRLLGAKVDIFAINESDNSYKLGDFDYSKYDILHTHGGRIWPGYLKHKLLWRKIKHIHTLHSVSTDYLFACRDWLNWRCYTSTVIEGVMAQQADHTICVSQAVKKLAEKWLLMSSDKMTVIYNGQNPKPEAGNRRREIRQRLGVGDDDILVIFVGRGYDKVKGAEKIKQAFDSLCLKYPQLKLLAMPGDGFEDRSWLIRSGAVKNDEMAYYYAAADIALNTSLSEGHPLSIVEPMGQGLAIIAAPVGGIPENIEHRKNGLLLKADRSDVAELLEELINKPELREKLGRNALRDSEKYTWAGAAEKTMGIYEGL